MRARRARRSGRAASRDLARPPEGGDTDEFRPRVGRLRHRRGRHLLLRPRHADEVEGLSEGRPDRLGPPQPETTGAHVDIAAAGLAAHAPHPDAAITFLEYLSTPPAKAYFANQNFEYPAVADATIGEVPASLGTFKADDLNLSVLGENQPAAQRIFNEIDFP